MKYCLYNLCLYGVHSVIYLFIFKLFINHGNYHSSSITIELLLHQGFLSLNVKAIKDTVLYTYYNPIDLIEWA